MQFKKVLWLAFVCLAALAVLAACGGNSGNDGNGGNGSNGVNSSNGGNSGNSGNSSSSDSESDWKNPVVTMEMTDGGIVTIELYPEIAPNTVASFVSLVSSGFYDGLTFHRVIPGFMIQGGDPNGNGTGGPGYTIVGEFNANGFVNDLKHERGVISMGRIGRQNDSAGSQFFIVVEDSPHLDGQYASFGKVLDGMDVVDRIVSVPTGQQDKPVDDQAIATMTVDTFGIDYGEPDKAGE